MRLRKCAAALRGEVHPEHNWRGEQTGPVGFYCRGVLASLECQDPEILWSRFSRHVQSCAVCRDPLNDMDDGRWRCAHGRELFLAWNRAEDRAVAQQAAEDAADMADCAEDTRAPWTPEIA